jgi:hypothetical protein
LFAQQIDQGKGVDNERMDKKLAMKRNVREGRGRTKREQVYIT